MGNGNRQRIPQNLKYKGTKLGMFFGSLISGTLFHPLSARDERENHKKSMVIVDHLAMSD
jgi:hypothetical protein